MSWHTVIPFAPSWAWDYSLPDVKYSFFFSLFKVRCIEHLRMVMHRQIKTRTAAQTAEADSFRCVFVCQALHIEKTDSCANECWWDRRVSTLNAHRTFFSVAFGCLISSWRCLCLSAVRVRDAAVYTVGTAVFHSHIPLSSPTATHTSVPNTPARSVEVNTHTQAAPSELV